MVDFRCFKIQFQLFCLFFYRLMFINYLYLSNRMEKMMFIFYVYVLYFRFGIFVSVWNIYVFFWNQYVIIYIMGNVFGLKNLWIYIVMILGIIIGKLRVRVI